MRRSVPIAVLAAAALAGTASAARTITVHGTGIVSSVPTNAVFTFGVSTDGATAAGALAANGRQMTRVIAALKAKGIASADIQTAELSVNANRSPNGNRILNYTASNSVTALVKQLANAGPVIDAAVAAGANQLSGPSLSSADQQTLSRRALQAAIADARARAGVIARAAGVPLGRVLSVSEVTSTPIPIEGAVSARAAAATPVEAGTVQTEADVNVTFAIG
jgi:uncharacterized protein YggE